MAITVPVYVTRTEDSAATAEITLATTSESDATKTDTATCSVTSQPTAVALRSFSARRAGAQTVVLRWRTGAEAGLLGFELYRGRSRLTRAPIPSQHATRGASYAYRDHLKSRAPAKYRLRAVSVRRGRYGA